MDIWVIFSGCYYKGCYKYSFKKYVKVGIYVEWENKSQQIMGTSPLWGSFSGNLLGVFSRNAFYL